MSIKAHSEYSYSRHSRVQRGGVSIQLNSKYSRRSVEPPGGFRSDLHMLRSQPDKHADKPRTNSSSEQ
eukprot:6918564-Prymnesium_polylepis.1